MKKSKRLRTQKLIGLAILALCTLILFVASKGTTATEKDAGVVIFIMPLGLYMLFTKKIIIS